MLIELFANADNLPMKSSSKLPCATDCTVPHAEQFQHNREETSRTTRIGTSERLSCCCANREKWVIDFFKNVPGCPIIFAKSQHRENHDANSHTWPRAADEELLRSLRKEFGARPSTLAKIGCGILESNSMINTGQAKTKSRGYPI